MHYQIQRRQHVEFKIHFVMHFKTYKWRSFSDWKHICIKRLRKHMYWNIRDILIYISSILWNIFLYECFSNREFWSKYSLPYSMFLGKFFQIKQICYWEVCNKLYNETLYYIWNLLISVTVHFICNWIVCTFLFSDMRF